MSLVPNAVLAHVAVHYDLDRLITPSKSIANDSYTHRLATVFEAWIGAAWIDAYHRGEEAEIWAWGAQFYDLSIWQGLSDKIELANRETVDPSALELGVRSQLAGSGGWLGRLLGPRTSSFFTRSKIASDAAAPKPTWTRWVKGLLDGSQAVEPSSPDIKSPSIETLPLPTANAPLTASATHSTASPNAKGPPKKQIKVVLREKTGWSSLNRPPEWPHPESYVNLSEFPALLPFMLGPDTELLRGEEMAQQGVAVWMEQSKIRLGTHCNSSRTLSYIASFMRRPAHMAHVSLYYNLNPAIWLPHRKEERDFRAYSDAFYAFLGWAKSQAKTGGHEKDFDMWLDKLVSPEAWPRMVDIARKYEEIMSRREAEMVQRAAKSVAAKSSKPSIVKISASGPLSPSTAKPAEAPFVSSASSDVIQPETSPVSHNPPNDLQAPPPYWHPPWLPLQSRKLPAIPSLSMFDQQPSLDGLWQRESDVYKEQKLKGHNAINSLLTTGGHLMEVRGGSSKQNIAAVTGIMLSRQSLAHIAWHYGIYSNHNMGNTPPNKTQNAAGGMLKTYIGCVVQEAEAAGKRQIVDQWLKEVFSPEVWTSLKSVLGLRSRDLMGLSRNPPRTKVKQTVCQVKAAPCTSPTTDAADSSSLGVTLPGEILDDGSAIPPTSSSRTTTSPDTLPDAKGSPTLAAKAVTTTGENLPEVSRKSPTAILGTTMSPASQLAAKSTKSIGKTADASAASMPPNTPPAVIASEEYHMTATPLKTPRVPPSHWQAPRLPFDYAKLPFTLPLYKSSQSMGSYPFAESKDGFAAQISAGRRVVHRLLMKDKYIRKAYGKDDVPPAVIEAAAVGLVSLQTMSHLALHYGFCEPKEQSGMTSLSQQATSGKFLACIGFISEEAEAIGAREEVQTWLKRVFSPDVWPTLAVSLDKASSSRAMNNHNTPSGNVDSKSDHKSKWLDPTLVLNTSALPPLPPPSPPTLGATKDDQTSLVLQDLATSGNGLNTLLFNRFQASQSMNGIARDCAQELTKLRNLSRLARFYKLYDLSANVSQANAARSVITYLRTFEPTQSSAKRVLPWLDVVFSKDVWPDLTTVVENKRHLAREEQKASRELLQGALQHEQSTIKLAHADVVEQTPLPEADVAASPSAADFDPEKPKEHGEPSQKPSLNIKDAANLLSPSTFEGVALSIPGPVSTSAAPRLHIPEHKLVWKLIPKAAPLAAGFSPEEDKKLASESAKQSMKRSTGKRMKKEGKETAAVTPKDKDKGEKQEPKKEIMKTIKKEVKNEVKKEVKKEGKETAAVTPKDKDKGEKQEPKKEIKKTIKKEVKNEVKNEVKKEGKETAAVTPKDKDKGEKQEPKKEIKKTIKKEVKNEVKNEVKKQVKQVKQGREQTNEQEEKKTTKKKGQFGLKAV
ncbi:hypothetical protein B9479_001276 [Cryptococcus floricola]|uniref:RNase III domain-containing protein n=1 Tax=Cryptococcus floricola TaxID=2591691 RepID=A0A5D3B5U3_9TREE|nr:hypothetical protein B9479_001276 [Cryptococcus floricola]